MTRVPPHVVTVPTPPPPPPLVNVHAPTRVDVAVSVTRPTSDTTTADSIQTILQRDFDQSGWLRVVSHDSTTHQNPIAVVRVTLAASAVVVTLIDGRTRRVYRSQTFLWPSVPPVASAPTPARPTTTNDSLRRAVLMAQRWATHGIADALLQWITGQTGIAQSRIAYVTGGEIHVIDQDGTDDRVFPNVGIVLSPAWSHDGRRLVYSTLTPTGTHLMELDLARGVVTRLTTAANGLNITPVYSPDDRWIVFAHGDESGTTLMALRRDSTTLERTVLREHGFDNSSPTFRPDGGRIAFVSARPKTPQIYSVDVNGSDERLETPFSPKIRSYRASPDWSPDGRTIAFEQQNGDFQLWLLTLADHTMRRVTASGDNEDPSWAPDSRHLAFTLDHHGAKEIWTLDTPTGELRQITHQGNARLAAWSPLFTKN